MKKFTINKTEVACETAEDLYGFTKVELMNYCMDKGIMLKGKASKEEFATHIFNTPALDTSDDLAPTLTGIQPVTPAEPQPAPAAEQTDDRPSASNAPAGMVFCKNCQKHVLKGKTVPTSVINEYICLMGCKKAAVASVKPPKASPSKEPKQPKKSGLYNDTDIITGIQWQPKSGSNSAKTVALMTVGMTVEDYIQLVDQMNARGECGTIKGRSDFAYHLKLNHVTITTAP